MFSGRCVSGHRYFYLLTIVVSEKLEIAYCDILLFLFQYDIDNGSMSVSQIRSNENH